MLVLSRKAGESVFIGDGICVTVLGVHKGRVRIGLKAPMEVPIRREELCEFEPGFHRSPPDVAQYSVRSALELVS